MGKRLKNIKAIHTVYGLFVCLFIFGIIDGILNDSLLAAQSDIIGFSILLVGFALIWFSFR